MLLFSLDACDPTRASPTRQPARGTNRRRRIDRGRLGYLAILATFALLLFSCKAPPEPIPTSGRWAATPPFFEVEGRGGATLQLLGTIHVGPAAGWSFPTHVEQAIRQASAIVIEIDLRDVTEESSSQAVMRHGILPADLPLSRVISPETAKLIADNEALLTMSGLPGHVREAMQPWLIAIMLVETMMQQLDYSTDQAVEEMLMSALGDRELVGLETLDEQLAFFGDLPLEIQELLLQDTLIGYESAAADLEALIAAWRINDQASLLRLARDGTEDLPELDALYEVILDGRNRNWIPRLIELLEDPRRADTTVLVGVGAQHLIGPTGVPNLLREAGYSVSTLDLRSPSANARLQPLDSTHPPTHFLLHTSFNTLLSTPQCARSLL
jgi:uncharacterized protein